MNVTLGVIADYANVSREGKLNIVGIFDTIYAQTFPCLHSQLMVILKIEADLNDSTAAERTFDLTLVDEHSQEILALNGHFNFKNSLPGELPSASSQLTLQNLIFKEPGNYSFKLSIDGVEKRNIPIRIRQVIS